MLVCLVFGMGVCTYVGCTKVDFVIQLLSMDDLCLFRYFVIPLFRYSVFRVIVMPVLTLHYVTTPHSLENDCKVV